MGYERPELTNAMPGRVQPWRELAQRLTVDNAAQGLMAAVADYFISPTLDPADQARRNDVLRRALRREQAEPFWIGDISPEMLTEYCIAISEAPTSRDQAIQRLESLGDSGVFKLLKGRANRWLPVPQ